MFQLLNNSLCLIFEPMQYMSVQKWFLYAFVIWNFHIGGILWDKLALSWICLSLSCLFYCTLLYLILLVLPYFFAFFSYILLSKFLACFVFYLFISFLITFLLTFIVSSSYLYWSYHGLQNFCGFFHTYFTVWVDSSVRVTSILTLCLLHFSSLLTLKRPLIYWFIKL